MTDDLEFFASQSRLSDPGSQAYLFDDLPASLPELVEVVQGLMVHVFWAKRLGLNLSLERQAEVQLRTIEKRLTRTLELDPRPQRVARPLREARTLETKIVGNCRDFTLLLVAMLRHKGIAARARCGFGAYFMPNHYEDHWVAEYWNAAESRWVLVDAQLDEFQCKTLHISFDPLDVPRDQFIVGGLAWQMCRSGGADPERFGIFDMHGLWFVRGDFVRDVAALNKVELLPWDCWGLINGDDASLAPGDWALLDRLAELTRGDVPDFNAVHALYESSPGLKVGKTFISWVDGKKVTVQLPADKPS
jgi:hypothetical protein